MIYGIMRGEKKKKKQEARSKKQETTKKKKRETHTHTRTLLTPPPTTIHQEDSEPLEATFELNDTLFAKAHIHRTQEVYLWLGVSSFLSSRLFSFLFFFFLTPTR